jgi:hypothetical protein
MGKEGGSVPEVAAVCGRVCTTEHLLTMDVIYVRTRVSRVYNDHDSKHEEARKTILIVSLCDQGMYIKPSL